MINLNKNIYFGDKKTKSGLALSIYAQKVANKYTKSKIINIQKTETLKLLYNYFPKEYIIGYFSMAYRTLILEQCFINEIKNQQTNKKYFLEKKQIKFLELKSAIKIIIKNIIKFFYAFKPNKDKKEITGDFCLYPKIGIMMNEGVNENLRSDIFWLNKTGIKNEEIIFIGKNVKSLYQNKFDRFSKIYDYATLDLLNVRPTRLSPEFLKLKKELIKINFNFKESKWLLINSLKLINEINFWKNIFLKYNIKVHLDGTENKLETISKQIALKLCSGVSIGKMRSYPINFLFHQYWPNDFFFTWGKDGAREVLESNNPISDVIISGFPYKLNFVKNDNKKFFTILILDNTFSDNLDLKQVVHSSFAAKIYSTLIEYLLKDQTVKIIIKTKKNIKLPIDDNILENAISTNRLEISKEIGSFAGDFTRRIDLAIAFGFYTPSALLECVIKKVRSVFIDYSNLKSVSKIIYNSNHKNIAFSDINDMMSALERFRKNKSKYYNFGNWDRNIKDIDPFNDNDGSYRIGIFIKTLLNSYKDGKDLYEIISFSKQNYLKMIKNKYKYYQNVIFSK